MHSSLLLRFPMKVSRRLLGVGTKLHRRCRVRFVHGDLGSIEFFKQNPDPCIGEWCERVHASVQVINQFSEFDLSAPMADV